MVLLMAARTQHEQALAQLAAAQRQVDALARIPETDTFPVGTVIRWRYTGDDPTIRVAVKTMEPVVPGWSPVARWQVTGQRGDLYNSWDGILTLLKQPLDFFEVAPTDWLDATVQTQPPVHVEQDEHTLAIQYDGRRWRYSPTFKEWVRSEDGS